MIYPTNSFLRLSFCFFLFQPRLWGCYSTAEPGAEGMREWGKGEGANVLISYALSYCAWSSSFCGSSIRPHRLRRRRRCLGHPVATSPNKCSQPRQPLEIDLVESILDFTIHVDDAHHSLRFPILSIVWTDQEDRDNNLATTFGVAGNMSWKGVRVGDHKRASGWESGSADALTGADWLACWFSVKGGENEVVRRCGWEGIESYIYIYIYSF